MNKFKSKPLIYSCDESVCSRRPGEEAESVRRLKMSVAFRMLSSGSRDIIPHALQLLPSTKVILLKVV